MTHNVDIRISFNVFNEGVKYNNVKWEPVMTHSIYIDTGKGQYLWYIHQRAMGSIKNDLI